MKLFNNRNNIVWEAKQYTPFYNHSLIACHIFMEGLLVYIIII